MDVSRPSFQGLPRRHARQQKGTRAVAAPRLSRRCCKAGQKTARIRQKPPTSAHSSCKVRHHLAPHYHRIANKAPVTPTRTRERWHADCTRHTRSRGGTLLRRGLRARLLPVSRCRTAERQNCIGAEPHRCSLAAVQTPVQTGRNAPKRANRGAMKKTYLSPCRNRKRHTPDVTKKR